MKMNDVDKYYGLISRLQRQAATLPKFGEIFRWDGVLEDGPIKKAVLCATEAIRDTSLEIEALLGSAEDDKQPVNDPELHELYDVWHDNFKT